MKKKKKSKIVPKTTWEEFDNDKSLIEYWKNQYVKTNELKGKKYPLEKYSKILFATH